MTPYRPASPCTVPGCPRRSLGHGLCAVHARQRSLQGDEQRGSASERGYGAAWRVIRDAYLADHPDCVSCGAPATDVDHIIARRWGGTDDEENLQALCHECHAKKTAKRDGGFGNRRGAL